MIFVGRNFKCSLGLNLGLRVEKPATNRLRFGTDQQEIEQGKGNRGIKGRTEGRKNES